MSNLNLKGIWIPVEILTDKKLSDKEKTIYAIIIYLSKENQYCFITNKTINELLNISATQVSNLINSLWLTLNNENMTTLTLLYYMQMQMLLYNAEHLHIEEQLL